MRKIKVADLKPGMIFSQPVFVDGENLLVPKGIALREQDIRRLLRWKIGEVQTEGEVVPPGAGATAGSPEEKLLWLNHRQARYLELYRLLVEQIDRSFQDLVAGKTVNHDGIDAIVNEILDKVRSTRTDMVQLILVGTDSPKKPGVSAINCAILCTVIGITLKLTGHRLLQLTTGALLHDVGMLRIPAEILQKKGKLTPEEQQQIHTHPIYGYRIISKELKYPEDVALLALQHQERWDGKGYPRRLKGEDIHLSARIVAVADAYEAMINVRPYRNPMISYSAMKAILSDNSRHFDPQVLRAFVESLGIYPIGSIVQLNNSAIGRVVENHGDAPLRPRVELLIDEYSARIEHPQLIDLLERKNLFIVKAIDPRAMNG
jgi:HD-GYP domain-containing protein (c-di-GMP phosphodiesterase class II)